MDTINQFLEVLEQIKNTCEAHHHGCDGCPYSNEEEAYNNCTIKEAVWRIHKRPCDYDIDDLTEVFKCLQF